MTCEPLPFRIDGFFVSIRAASAVFLAAMTGRVQTRNRVRRISPRTACGHLMQDSAGGDRLPCCLLTYMLIFDHTLPHRVFQPQGAGRGTGLAGGHRGEFHRDGAAHGRARPESGPATHSGHGGDGLFEVRARGVEGIGRAFFCTLVGQRIVVRHGFVKKTQATPAAE